MRYNYIFPAIKYPEHDLTSRRVIWRKFFELAGVKTHDAIGSGRSTPTDMIKLDHPAEVAVITDAELDKLAEKPFNGRTIKNLVRTAQALALSSYVLYIYLPRGNGRSMRWIETNRCQRRMSTSL